MSVTTESFYSATVDEIVRAVGPALRVATPLGLGKPNRLLNALYQRVKQQPEQLSLHLYTALSLQRPGGRSGLEQRFLAPFVARHFGEDYPDLDYLIDRQRNAVPAHIRIHEFYFTAGSQLGKAGGQRHYISQNYTHVARDLAHAGINLVLLQVARRGERYSLSCNPDVAPDLIDRLRARGTPPYVVGVVHDGMPFLGGDAEVPATFFDLLLTDPAPARLFAIPREPVRLAEHVLGLHASLLVKDGGTLQIGIGALSDALVNAMLLRQQRNDRYRAILSALHDEAIPEAFRAIGGIEPFQKGLYGATEMVMDGFMHLRKAGILSRLAYDDLGLQTLLNEGVLTDPLAADSLEQLLRHDLLPDRLHADAVRWLQQFGMLPSDARWHNDAIVLGDGRQLSADLNEAGARAALAALMTGRRLQNGHYLAGAFALGSVALYDWLKQLSGDDWRGLEMQRVSRINELYGGSENLERAQRRDARFFNTCMMQTLLGAAVSDGLADGQTLSGVGGQYNFVAMAHALHDGRSVLLLRATREAQGRTVSNLVWNYGHVTIPRHLRDLVVTEYGIADLRGQPDEEIIKRLLAICDARFQDDLLAAAKRAHKIDPAFAIPPTWRRNTPEHLRERLAPWQAQGEFARFPFGSDFDDTEQTIVAALLWLKQHTGTRGSRLRTVLRALLPQPVRTEHRAALERMALTHPGTIGERLQARLLRLALSECANATD